MTSPGQIQSQRSQRTYYCASIAMGLWMSGTSILPGEAIFRPPCARRRRKAAARREASAPPGRRRRARRRRSAEATGPPKGSALLRRGRAEIHRRRPAQGALVLYSELRLFAVAEEHRGQVGREGAHDDVVLLHRADVAVARDRDAVLGALELGLQVAEVLVRLELGVALHHDQQPRQRRGEFALGLLE